MWGLQEALRAQAAKRPSRKQESVVSLAEAWLGTHRHLGHAESQQTGEPAPRVTPCSERRALGTTSPAAAATCTLVLGQPTSTRSSRTGRRKSNETLELQLSPIKSMLLKQEMLPGCQSSSLAFQSVLEQLLVKGWALPVLGDIAAKNLECRREVAHGM